MRIHLRGRGLVLLSLSFALPAVAACTLLATFLLAGTAFADATPEATSTPGKGLHTVLTATTTAGSLASTPTATLAITDQVVTVMPTALTTETPTPEPSPTMKPPPTATRTPKPTTTPTRTPTSAPTATDRPSDTPEPTITPVMPTGTLAPTVAPSVTLLAATGLQQGAGVPIASPTPGSRGPSGNSSLFILLGAAMVALGVLGAVAFTVYLLRGRRGGAQPAPVPQAPQPPLAGSAPGVQEPAQKAVVAPPSSPRAPVSPVSASQPLTSPPQPGIPYLESASRPAGTLYYPLRDMPATLGRAPDNCWVIDEQYAGWPTVARHHARIEKDGDDFIVIDQRSENGVLVDGQRTGTNVLHDGCVLNLGRVGFIFRANRGGGAA